MSNLGRPYPDLSPPPQKLRWREGTHSSHHLEKILGPTGRPEHESYRLTVDRHRAVALATTDAGFFYAEQTWRQLQAEFGNAVPCMEILDWPDYAVRGFYHDVSRGKVPTLATLLELAERCAEHKLNHLELYIEHTFAYRNHSEVWAGSDPLTAQEILALDARCAELHIDLVPSFSTFGHCYGWIHDKFPELNELERDVSRDLFCWHDRMAHYTLDCRNPRSLELVREIIREVRPLFRSKHFNICADETFDLGKGRNRLAAEKLGQGRLYVDFLRQVMAVVQEVGAIPLFWGDIIGRYPELLGELPAAAVVLDWDYSADLSHTKAELLAKSGRTFYVCPSVAGHNRWLPDFAHSYHNIQRFARLGRTTGAVGLLNTDWGDFGHVHTLGATWPGLAFGAAAAWNGRSRALGKTVFQEMASRRILGDPSGRLMGILEQASSAARAQWTSLCWLHQPRSADFGPQWFDHASGLPQSFSRHSPRGHMTAWKKMVKLRDEAEKLRPLCRPSDPWLMEEISVALLALEVMELVVLFYLARARGSLRLPIAPPAIHVQLRELDCRLGVVWAARNKPSELFRIREIFEGIARDLASAGGATFGAPAPEKKPAAGRKRVAIGLRLALAKI